MKLLLINFLEDHNILGMITIDYPLSDLGDIDLMNGVLLMNHGQKKVRNSVVNIPIEKLAKMIVLTNRKKWDDLKKALRVEINILSGNTNRVVENIKGSNDYTDSTKNLEKVSGYNSEELIINSGNETDFKHAGGDETERVMTTDNGALSESLNNLIIASELNIINLIISDIASLLTIEIY